MDTWITTHLPTTEGLKSELVQLADLPRTVYWSPVNHRPDKPLTHYYSH